MRINLGVEAGSRLKFTAKVNGVVAADTLLMNAGAMTWEFPVTGLKVSGGFGTELGFLLIEFFGLGNQFPLVHHKHFCRYC